MITGRYGVMNEEGKTFEESSKIARDNEQMWIEYYQKKYPGCDPIKTKEEKSILQDGGVDRIIIKVDGQQETADEKTLQNVYDEIALEYISNSTTNSPGWICKPLICDSINYAFAPTKEIYSFNRIVLQKVWKKYGNKWLETAKKNILGGPHIVISETKLRNGLNYLSYSCAIPIYILEQVYKEELIKSCIDPIRYCLYDDQEYYNKLKNYKENKDNVGDINRKIIAKRIKEIKK